MSEKIRVEIIEKEFQKWCDDQCVCKHDVGIDEIAPVDYFPNVSCDDQIRLRYSVWDYLVKLSAMQLDSEERPGEDQ